MTIYSVYCWKERPIGWYSEEAIVLADTKTCNVNNEEIAVSYMAVNELEYNYFTVFSYEHTSKRKSEVKVKKLYYVDGMKGNIVVLEKHYTMISRPNRKSKSIENMVVKDTLDD